MRSVKKNPDAVWMLQNIVQTQTHNAVRSADLLTLQADSLKVQSGVVERFDNGQETSRGV